MAVGAEDMASMRMHAIGLALQWLIARDYKVSPDGHAYFYIRAHDLGLKPQVLQDSRIKVELTFEEEPSS